jgi:hypothetical protein
VIEEPIEVMLATTCLRIANVIAPILSAQHSGVT